MTFLQPGHGGQLHSRGKSTHAPRQGRIQLFPPNKTQLGLVSRTPVVRRQQLSRCFRLLAGSLNQNPICLYFLFSAGSPCGSSFDDRAACSCARVSKPASLCLHTFAGNTWNVSLCALLHLQAQKLSDRRRRRRGKQPALQPSARSRRFALLCTAPLCQATDNTQPRL